MAESSHARLLILGSGPAGYTAARADIRQKKSRGGAGRTASRAQNGKDPRVVTSGE